jgi:hypothetical protein
MMIAVIIIINVFTYTYILMRTHINIKWQVVAGRHFISSPPEYDASKVRVWRMSAAAAAALERQ